MSRRLYPAVYIASITAVATLATWTANLLPIDSPTTAWAANVAAGCLGVLAATTWLPCPCHRKDSR
jgi:hypothetical protein